MGASTNLSEVIDYNLKIFKSLGSIQYIIDQNSIGLRCTLIFGELLDVLLFLLFRWTIHRRRR